MHASSYAANSPPTPGRRKTRARDDWSRHCGASPHRSPRRVGGSQATRGSGSSQPGPRPSVHISHPFVQGGQLMSLDTFRAVPTPRAADGTRPSERPAAPTVPRRPGIAGRRGSGLASRSCRRQLSSVSAPGRGRPDRCVRASSPSPIGWTSIGHGPPTSADAERLERGPWPRGGSNADVVPNVAGFRPSPTGKLAPSGSWRSACFQRAGRKMTAACCHASGPRRSPPLGAERSNISPEGIQPRNGSPESPVEVWPGRAAPAPLNAGTCRCRSFAGRAARA